MRLWQTSIFDLCQGSGWLDRYRHIPGNYDTIYIFECRNEYYSQWHFVAFPMITLHFWNRLDLLLLEMNLL